MNFIRISKFRIINPNHILSIGYVRQGFKTTECIQIVYNIPMTSGGFAFFDSTLDDELIYEMDDPKIYDHFRKLIDTNE